MPPDAVRCSCCHSWRSDIHLLIAAYFARIHVSLAILIVGVVLGVVLFLVGFSEAVEQAKGGSPFAGLSGVKILQECAKSPLLLVGVLLFVLSIVVRVLIQLTARRIRHSIEKKSNGLWRCPVWLR